MFAKSLSHPADITSPLVLSWFPLTPEGNIWYYSWHMHHSPASSQFFLSVVWCSAAAAAGKKLNETSDSNLNSNVAGQRKPKQ